MWNKLLMMLLPLILTVVSPQLRVFLTEILTDLETKAKQTDNPWDDMFVALLKAILLGDK